MQTLESLLTKLESTKATCAAEQAEIRAAILKLLAPTWNADKALQRDIECLEQFDRVEYAYAPDGGIDAWVRCYEVSDVPEEHRAYFEEYLQDRCIRVDFDNEALMTWLGDDAYSINEGGDVFEGDKHVFSVEDYSERDGDYAEPSDAKLAWLIEQRMEAQGVFPGVFRTDRHGNVFPFATVELAKQYKIGGAK